MTLLTQSARTATAGQTLGGQLPSLTGMRWFAALVVFLYHVHKFGYFGEGEALVGWAFAAGNVGVSFFFVLSGFVLAWSARPGDRVLMFWRRRLARIYPLHLVTAAIAVVLALTLIPELRPGRWEAAANLLLVSTWRVEWWQALNPVSWSLACEAFFYALFPALYAGVRRLGPRGLWAVLALAGAAVLVIPWVKLHFGFDWVLLSFPAARLPEFCLGVVACRLVQLGRWRGPGLEASVALTVIGYFLTYQVASPYRFAACTVIGLVCLISAAALSDVRGTPSLWRRPTLVRLGEWSFAFYMIHILVMQTCEVFLGVHPKLSAAPALLATAAAFGVSLVLAWALYERVELPGRRLLLGKRARRR
ncbi:acyltransferase [Streptomyces sp.]|uniref:acyltransferase family protein n=1 Tax=Streptomyces sp. TaxID=1931 RepID=UPI002F91C24E